MANRARGQIKARIGDSDLTLSLSLGALAELEDAFHVESFEEALDFTKPSARRLRMFMAAIIRGNSVEVTDDLARKIDDLSISEFMAIVTGLMDSSGLKGEAASMGDAEGASPLAAQSAGERG